MFLSVCAVGFNRAYLPETAFVRLFGPLRFARRDTLSRTVLSFRSAVLIAVSTDGRGRNRSLRAVGRERGLFNERGMVGPATSAGALCCIVASERIECAVLELGACAPACGSADER